ncbi:MAG: hypothetical protein J0H60_08580 [Rhizobiales bacterium]|nr:hypothetical protein [Hyphomicrobiales bacterium]
MAISAAQGGRSRADRIGALLTRFPVVAVWIGASLFLILCRLAGYRPDNDFDDILKLIEIRNFLDTGAWFDRTIPGILQPEPFVSHWIRLIDLPYAVVAAPLGFLLDRESALAVASFVVPLVLLLPTLFSYRVIVRTLGLAMPERFFPLSVVFMLPALFEFEPGRIDYHNMEIMLAFAALALTLASERPLASTAAGVVTALALAISVEFAVFFAVIMADHALAYVSGKEGAEKRMACFGLALTGAALALFPIIVPPGQYGAVHCDVYSMPHLLALLLAGVAFAGVAISPSGIFRRTITLTVLAAASLAVLLLLFPQCTAGPYAALSDYIRENWLAQIDQEKSLLHRPDVILSPGMAAIIVYMAGIGALAAAAIRKRPASRGFLVFSFLGVALLAESILYFRYFRYITLFAGPGLVLALVAFHPRLSIAGFALCKIVGTCVPRRRDIVAPVVVASLVIISFGLSQSRSESRPASGADFAGSCDMSRAARLTWPAAARIFSPPDIAIRLLAQRPGASVVTIPHHPAWHGIERVYRFLDPRTPEPRQYLDQTKATHVAICAWRGPAIPGMEKAYPLTAQLVEGHPPGWLVECPLPASSPLRVYRYPAAGGAAGSCPKMPLSSAN